jgi:hypothetical protein
MDRRAFQAYNAVRGLVFVRLFAATTLTGLLSFPVNKYTGKAVRKRRKTDLRSVMKQEYHAKGFVFIFPGQQCLETET